MLIVYLDKSLHKIKISELQKSIDFDFDDDDFLTRLPDYEYYIFIGYYMQFTYEIVSKIYSKLQAEKHCLCQLFPVMFNFNYKSYFLSQNSKNKECLILDALNNTDEIVNQIIENQLLNHYYTNILIVAHGEGIHIKLGETTLCSLLGDKEYNRLGKIIHNGCSKENCRRLNKRIKRRLRCKDIRCENLYLLSCNSGNIAGDLFNSSSSLARGFLEEGVKKYLGCIELHDYSTKDIELVKFLILDGYSTLEICYLLNKINYLKNKRLPFCVYSMDIFTISNGFNIKKFSLNKSFELISNHIVLLDMKYVKKSNLYTYKINEDSFIFTWMGIDILILYSKTKSVKITIYDSIDLFNDIVKKIIKTFAWLEFWDDYFYYMNLEVMKNNTKYFIEKIKSKKEKLVKIKNAHICNYEELNNFLNSIKVDINNFEKIIYKHFITENSVSCIEKILFLFENIYIPEKLVCNRCSNEINSYRLKSINKTYNLNINYCGVCGIRSITSSQYIVDSYLSINSKTEYRIVILLNYSTLNIKLNNRSFIYIEIYDKAEGVIVQKILKLIEDFKDAINIPIERENIIGNDLHTYRGIIIHELEPIYFRGRFSI